MRGKGGGVRREKRGSEEGVRRGRRGVRREMHVVVCATDDCEGREGVVIIFILVSQRRHLSATLYFSFLSLFQAMRSKSGAVPHHREFLVTIVLT